MQAGVHPYAPSAAHQARPGRQTGSSRSRARTGRTLRSSSGSSGARERTWARMFNRPPPRAPAPPYDSGSEDADTASVVRPWKQPCAKTSFACTRAAVTKRAHSATRGAHIHIIYHTDTHKHTEHTHNYAHTHIFSPDTTAPHANPMRALTHTSTHTHTHTHTQHSNDAHAPRALFTGMPFLS